MDPIILFFSAAILATGTFAGNIITSATATTKTDGAKEAEIVTTLMPIQHDVTQMLVYNSSEPTMIVHEGDAIIPDRPEKKDVSAVALAINNEPVRKNINTKIWIIQNKTAVDFKLSEEANLRPLDETALNNK